MAPLLLDTASTDAYSSPIDETNQTQANRIANIIAIVVGAMVGCAILWYLYKFWNRRSKHFPEPYTLPPGRSHLHPMQSPDPNARSRFSFRRRSPSNNVAARAPSPPPPFRVALEDNPPNYRSRNTSMAAFSAHTPQGAPYPYPSPMSGTGASPSQMTPGAPQLPQWMPTPGAPSMSFVSPSHSAGSNSTPYPAYPHLEPPPMARTHHSRPFAPGNGSGIGAYSRSQGQAQEQRMDSYREDQSRQGPRRTGSQASTSSSYSTRSASRVRMADAD